MVIQLEHISKQYANQTIALQDFNLTIDRGQFVTLVGPSGCGKSTALKIIAGLATATEGTVHWTDPSLQHQIGYVFQDASLMPWSTVRDNILLPLRIAHRNSATAAAAVQQLLELVGLQHVQKMYPRQLSGGMKMRVSIARALVTEPSLLLMDEPFGALDEMTRSRLNGELLHLWEKQQWTVLFVTHSIYEAVYLSQRVVVMAANPGRVVADIEIDAPYPRSETFRTSALYNDYCREILEAFSRHHADQPPLF